ncbi:hypothetical protein BY458DRAFT_545941 [Sporodiniella umbellata]|nr:hypothetical protein BY458DRAFT_545941 [Sporodiniella umbellata]
MKDREDPILPWKWKSGEGCMSKLLLSDSNLAVHCLVGIVLYYFYKDSVFLPIAIFQPKIEWPDGNRLALAYVSPILIELQYQVDQGFMLRSIAYPFLTYERYTVLSIFLITLTKSFSSTGLQKEFTIGKNGFLLEASCNFLVKKARTIDYV